MSGYIHRGIKLSAI